MWPDVLIVEAWVKSYSNALAVYAIHHNKGVKCYEVAKLESI